MERLDDAVKEDSSVKMAMGLIARANGKVYPPPPLDSVKDDLERCVGCAAHRRIARRAVSGSLVAKE